MAASCLKMGPKPLDRRIPAPTRHNRRPYLSGESLGGVPRPRRNPEWTLTWTTRHPKPGRPPRPVAVSPDPAVWWDVCPSESSPAGPADVLLYSDAPNKTTPAGHRRHCWHVTLKHLPHAPNSTATSGFNAAYVIRHVENGH